MHPSSQYHKELAHIVRADKDNKRCCDCGKNNPRWASTNLGCFMCLECSGIHRAIGVHITKIKSITLDKWTRNEVEYMKTVGNRIHNARWEAFLENGQGIMPQSSMRERDIFIRAKYNNRKWFSNIPKDQLPPPAKLDNAGSAKPQFQTAAQRAKMRREKAAREKAEKAEADRLAALKAKEESEAQARIKKANDDKLASRRAQKERRLSDKQKQKEAARLRRQQRKNQRVRRRSKELNSLYQQTANTNNNKDDDALIGEVVVATGNNDNNSVNNKNNQEESGDLLDLMSGDQFSTSPVTTPNLTPSNNDVAVSGFSFLSNNNNNNDTSGNNNNNITTNAQQEPPAPQVDTMVSGFSFLSATTDTNIATTDVKEETSAPVIMSTNNNSNAIDSAFADLAALAPTPPTIQDNSNTTTPVTSQPDNNNTSTTTTSNLSSTTLNENDVVQLESTLGQVQQTVQWYSEALNAYIEAKTNLKMIEEKVQNANGDTADLMQRISYLKEQVMATHSFINSFASMSEGQ